jgi:hypothetical protein
MAIRTNVYVTYDTTRNKLTLTGGNTAANDGACDFDSGPGNEITFEQAGANAGDWSLTDVTWTPASPDVLEWAWAGTDIELTDNGNEGVKNTVVYTCTVYGRADSNTVASDPVIITKPADGVAQLRASASQR